MDVRCQICGSEKISLRHSNSSVLGGDRFVCSSTCFVAANRYSYVVLGFLTLFLPLITLDIMIIIFFIPFSLTLFRFALKAFSLANKPFHSSAYMENIPLGELSDPSKFAINNPPNSILKNSNLVQFSSPKRELSNGSEYAISEANIRELSNDLSYQNQIIIEKDPQGFFNLSNGKLKQTTRKSD